MREAGLVGASHRRGGPVTTRRDKDARPAPTRPAPGRARSTATSMRPRQTSCGSPISLTVPTAAGLLHPAVVLYAWSRKIVGWSMANHLRTELVLDAMAMAVGQRRPKDVIHHSDLGQPDTSVAFGGRCGEAGVRPRWDRSVKTAPVLGLVDQQRHGREFLLHPRGRAAQPPPGS